MGMYEQRKCIFTGYDCKPIIDGRDAIEYWVEVNGNNFFIRLPYYAPQWEAEEKFFVENKWLFKSLLYNNQWFENKETSITIDELKNLIDRASFPRTPREKRDNLIAFLSSLQKEDGERVTFADSLYDSTFPSLLYFKSPAELSYYIKTLHEENLISGIFLEGGPRRHACHSFQITFKGLNYLLELENSGESSLNCFIAMSFQEGTEEIRASIKEAVVSTGYNPIIIDEENIDSDRTINDAIIASLKKCKFCIADFTNQSKGVYFESGHALGQGKKVIYTCLKSDFEKAHFDIRPLQQIIYETPEELKKRLIDKIEAWIK